MSVTWRSLVPKKHWSLPYFVRRIRLEAWQRANPDAPWLAPEAVAFLEEWLRPSDLVVEFGAGRSTLWFSRLVGKVFSVEHDPAWHARVVQRAQETGATNTETLLVVDDEEQYLQVARDRIDRADVVLVDGLNRDNCAMWALECVRPGGAIIIDNAERYLPSRSVGPESIGAASAAATPGWQRFDEAIRPLRKVWFDCGIWSTLVVFVQDPA